MQVMEERKEQKGYAFDELNKGQDNDEALDTREKLVRRRANHNIVWLLCLNLYSTLAVFIAHLISLESVLSVALSVAVTLFLFYNPSTTIVSTNGDAMNWVLLSFAVITPLANSISMAFTRREKALTCIAVLRASLVQLYLAHSIWDWGKTIETGKWGTNAALDPRLHSSQLMESMVQLQNDLARYLTMPNRGRARHRATLCGKGEAEAIEDVSNDLYERIVLQLTKFSRLCEDLKRAGMPGNEASRIRQWEHGVLSEIEKLRMIKGYRTPQGLRSFGRLFSVFLPPLYAPYYAHLATELNSLGMGISFSIITSIALTALFETVYALEDPFEPRNLLDGIDVHDELVVSLTQTLEHQRTTLFPEQQTTFTAPA